MGDPRQVTLADVLLGLGKPWDLDEARRALLHPFAWPSDPQLAIAAENFRKHPRPIGPGEALLVTVSGARASLFRLIPDPLRASAPLLGSSSHRLERARRLVLRDAPWLAPSRVERTPTWGALRVAKRGPQRDETIVGDSLDLAFALAALSEHTGVPLPSDFCASAVVNDDGSLGAVDGLELKLAIVADWTLGVTRFVVAEAQSDEASTLAARLSRPIEIVAARDLAEAIAKLCPALVAPPTVSDSEADRELADTAFYLALSSSEWLVGWSALRATCEALAAGLSGEAQRRARFAAAIAARHQNLPHELAWDETWLRGLPRSLRLRALAHIVQSAAENHARESAPTARRALPFVAPRLDRTREDLELLGAIGRALAADGEIATAISLLEEAVEDWQGIGERHASSHAFCELARLVGAHGDAERLHAHVLPRGARLLHDQRVSASSRAHIALQLGRALVLLGRFEEARANLDHASLDRFVEQARLRWLACALDALGKASEADALRERLGTGSDYGLLAQLDGAARDGRDGTAHLVALKALEPLLFAQLERWAGATPDVVRRWWRY